MARQKVIVKRLNAIQNFGATDMLCTDKTGALTQGKIVLEKHLDVHGDPSEKVLHYGYLNSYHYTGLKNLLDDFSQTAIPTDAVDAEWLTKPRQWTIGAIQRFILFIGPVSSIFDYPTFFMMLYVFNAWHNPALFHTGWFVESLIT